MKYLSGLFFVLSAICGFKGFNKMLVYSNPEGYYRASKNVYVGGDAYNYIINSNYTTAFFVLTVGFLIAGFMCILISKHNKMLENQALEIQLIKEAKEQDIKLVSENQ